VVKFPSEKTVFYMNLYFYNPS